MAEKKTTGKTEQTEAKKVPAIAKSAALAEPEKKKLPAKTKNTPKKPAEKAGKSSAGKKTAAPAKETKVAAENFFEIDGSQIREEDIRTRIEEAYKDAGHRVSAIKKLQVYYNFAERRAYYVINGKPEGLYIAF